MKAEDIVACCLDLLSDHLDRGPTVELFKAIYAGPLDDFDSIFDAIRQVDQHTRKTLDRKIDTALMDLARNRETIGEAFIFRLRAESAVAMLSILANSKLALELKTEIPEEAVVWALNTLWRGSCAQWAYRTAKAFLAGRPSALEPQFPA